MITAADIIAGCGGTSALAEALHLTPSTVSSWIAANHIPRWWHDKVLKVAKKRRYDLSADQFPVKVSRRARSGLAA